LLAFFKLKDAEPSEAPSLQLSTPAPRPCTFDSLGVCSAARRPAHICATFRWSWKPGQSLAIVGPVGAGKTVLLRLLLAEFAASAGTVRWSGSVRSFAYCPQETFIASGTLRDNLTLFGEGERLQRRRTLAARPAVGQSVAGGQAMAGRAGHRDWRARAEPVGRAKAAGVAGQAQCLACRPMW
jgi:ABC-type transport system involved in cytochrome bd biosynthesis fused ATPase/permease subunit